MSQPTVLLLPEDKPNVEEEVRIAMERAAGGPDAGASELGLEDVYA